jgi:hypothetical protein
MKLNTKLNKHDLLTLKNKVYYTYTYDDAMSEIISSLRAAAILHKSHVTLRSTHHKWLNNLAIAIPVTNTLKMANLTYYISHDPLYTTLRIHL